MRWQRALAGIAGVVAAAALTVYAFHLRASRLPPRAPDTHAGATAGPVFFDVACVIPEDWAGLPVIAHVDTVHASMDEHTFVLTVHDPDAVAKAIAAFSRNPKAR